MDVNVATGTQRYEGFDVVVDMWRSQTMGEEVLRFSHSKVEGSKVGTTVTFS